MSFFPIFLNLKNKKILVIGGGKIATNKTKRLLKFSSNITIISPTINSKLEKLIKKRDLIYIQKRYNKSDLNDFFLVICAINSISLQKEIANVCEEKKILFNCVDGKELSNIIFPSIIKKRNLTISFSTNGTSPAFTKHIKKFFLQLLPQNLDDFLDKLNNLRQKHPKGKKRQKLLNNKVKNYFKKLNRAI